MIWRGGNEVDAIVGGWVTDGKWLTSDDEMSGKDDSRWTTLAEHRNERLMIFNEED